MQSYDTPSLNEPLLSKIGLCGDGPAVDDILHGNFELEGLDPITQAYYNDLEYPPDFTPPLKTQVLLPCRIDRTSRKPKRGHHHHHQAFTTVYGRPMLEMTI